MAWDRLGLSAAATEGNSDSQACTAGDVAAVQGSISSPHWAQEITPGPSAAGCWDLSPKPLLLAGDDGITHQTKPTTTLARDLAAAEQEMSQPAASPAQRRSMNPDDRPIQSSVGWWPIDSSRSAGMPSGVPMSPSTKRHSLGSRGSSSSQASGGYSSGASSLRPFPVSPQKTSGTGSASLPLAWGNTQRRTSKQYSPMQTLVDMGFDEESAKVAIAAANGDVDRAVRIAVEDSKAHNAWQDHGGWEFEGDMGWSAFDCETNSLIDKAVKRGDTACEIRTAGRRYFIDLASLTQLNLATQRTRRIRKRGDVTQQ